MADNVLSSLFLSIAEAIRSKNGETGVLYSPAEFPGKIEKLDVSGGGSGEGSGGLVVTSGSFTADSETATISHNLGVVPDVFGIFGAISGKADTDMPTDAMALVASVGISQRLLDEHQVKKAGGNFVSGNMMLLSSTGTSTGFDGDDDFMGRLHNATATTIDVGCAGTNGKLFVGKLYSWFAIGRKS